MPRSGFQTFVALRYLMAHPFHVSGLALMIAGVALVIAVAAGVGSMFVDAPDPKALVPTGSPYWEPMRWTALINAVVAGLCLYIFAIRVFFTFYSTVSIAGVSIGGAALVLVLSVMNGFESDLRQKILGSNAHVQISKEDGEFTEWEEVRARVDRIPGVKASTLVIAPRAVAARDLPSLTLAARDLPSLTPVPTDAR